MLDHTVATREDWLAARKALLAEEKEFTRARDALSAKRRALPWVRIDKPYRFEGPEGHADPERPFRPQAAVDRPTFHVRPRLGEALQELLVLGRRL